MHIVAWNTAIPVLNICNDPFGYESENKAKPDTFEAYAIALRDAANGYTETLKTYTAATNLTKEAHRRMNEIVIIGLQAATQGRMSITYLSRNARQYVCFAAQCMGGRLPVGNARSK